MFSVAIGPHVQEALDKHLPIVALESTIISHGMPYPDNVQTALAVEDLVRREGAVPATVAIIGGVPTVGITPDQIQHLGQMGTKVTKASRRDIAVLAALGKDGATTVAATMMLAQAAGVTVFATGGIGGVHRGAETTMDISADLEELARTDVTVVCAGAKSILDLGLTMEYLETKGVPVIGYRTDVLPAFYTNSSRYKVTYRMDEARQIARAIAAKRQLGIAGGMLVVNPIPQQYSMDADYIEQVIEEALQAAKQQGISGKDTTPFLLAEICRLTGGDSLKSNIQLVYNNVRLACAVAVELAAMTE